MKKYEKEILKYASRLEEPLKKCLTEEGKGGKNLSYDFTKAKTAKQKVEVINMIMGEIIRGAVFNKDTKNLERLVEYRMKEIEEL